MKKIDHKMVGFILTIILLLLCPHFAFSLENSVELTDVGIGARSVALGNVITGIADDASAVFINPAGLGLQNRMSFISMSTQLLTDVDYKVLGFAYPTRFGTFGIGYIGATTPAGDNIHMEGSITVEGGPIYYSNEMLVLSYGCDISPIVNDVFFDTPAIITGLSAGANFKLLSQKFSGDISNPPSASGMQADIGVIYKATEKLSIGAMAQNVYRGSAGESITWSTDEKEKLPTSITTGCSLKATDNITFVVGSNSPLGTSQKTGYGFGVEWQIIPLIALRAGVSIQDESALSEVHDMVSKPSIGLGVNYAGFRFDYAYKHDLEFSDLSTSYFSIGYVGMPILTEIPSEMEEGPLEISTGPVIEGELE